jgi:hypothetical protein
MNQLISAGIERIAMPEWEGEVDDKRSDNGRESAKVIQSYVASLVSRKEDMSPPLDIYKQIAQDLLDTVGSEAYLEAIEAATSYLEVVAKDEHHKKDYQENSIVRASHNVHAWFRCACAVARGE